MSCAVPLAASCSPRPHSCAVTPRSSPRRSLRRHCASEHVGDEMPEQDLARERVLVCLARGHGASWDAIGESVGMTAQGAESRWSDAGPSRDV
jgi:hypothetical protein